MYRLIVTESGTTSRYDFVGAFADLETHVESLMCRGAARVEVRQRCDGHDSLVGILEAVDSGLRTTNVASPDRRMGERHTDKRLTPLLIAGSLLLMFASWAGAQTTDGPTTPPDDGSGEAVSAPQDGEDAPADEGEGAEHAETLRAAFAEVPTLTGVTVTVRHRVAILSGRTETPAAREAAAAIARKIPELLYVDNRVKVDQIEPPPSEDAPVEPTDATPTDQVVDETLTAVFSQVRSLQGARVKTRGGVVTLEGEAATPEAIKKAGDLARSQEGVLYVDNRLVETRDVGERLAPLVDRFFSFVRDAIAALPLALIALVVMAAAVFFARRVRESEFGMFRYLRDNPLLLGIVQRLAMLAVLLVGAFIALQLMGMGFVLGALLGGAGIVGVALSFAFRDIIENFLAGVILSIRQPFRAKDFVEINSETGNVIRLTPSATILMTADGNHVRIPNSDVFKGVVTNVTRNPKRRFDFAVGVAPNADLLHAQNRGVEALKDIDGVLADPEPSSWVEEIGDSTVTLRFTGWVDQRESSFLKLKGAAIRVVMEALALDEIDMPEPTYRLTIVGGAGVDSSSVAAIGSGGNGRSSPPARKPSASSVVEEDTSPDSTIEDQIDEEKRLTETANDDLLSDEPARLE